MARMARPRPDYRKAYSLLRQVVEIERAVRRGDYPSQARLARLLEVSGKTVQRRLHFMREMLDAPLAYDDRRKGWHFTEPHWRPPAVSLRNRELVALELACRAALHHPLAPWAEDLRRLFQKLTDGLGNAVRIEDGAAGPAFHFGATPASRVEPATLATVLRAIELRRTVQMDYHVLGRDRRTTREVDPYVLRAVRGVWYLAGRDHLYGQVPLFNLSRVTRIKLGTRRIDDVAAATFDADQYFQHALFASVGRHPLRVELEFTGAPARLVAEFEWHQSQTLVRVRGGRTRLTLDVADSDELRAWILGWGAAVVVRKPLALRDAIATEHRAAAARYGRRGRRARR